MTKLLSSSTISDTLTWIHDTTSFQQYTVHRDIYESDEDRYEVILGTIDAVLVRAFQTYQHETPAVELSIPHLITWLTNYKQLDNDSDDARRELRSTTIWEFQSDINTFYNHLTNINERIKQHTLKDQEFQYAFIEGMIPSIREPLINWFEDLRYFHKIAVTSADLRNKAIRLHRNNPSPLLSDIQSIQLECNPVSYLGTVSVTDVWHNKYLKGKLRDWIGLREALA